MSNFVKIGKHRFNLDQVTDVVECSDGTVYVYWNFLDGEGAICRDTLSGDQGKLLLAIIDQDDDAVDAIYERMYNARRVVLPPEEPAASFGTPVEAADEVDTSRGYPINFINLTNS